MVGPKKVVPPGRNPLLTEIMLAFNYNLITEIKKASGNADPSHGA